MYMYSMPSVSCTCMYSHVHNSSLLCMHFIMPGVTCMCCVRMLLQTSIFSPSGRLALLVHHHYMRKKLPPKGGKGGVAQWAHRLYTCCLLVKLPHLTFGSAAGKELDV